MKYDIETLILTNLITFGLLTAFFVLTHYSSIVTAQKEAGLWKYLYNEQKQVLILEQEENALLAEKLECRI